MHLCEHCLPGSVSQSQSSGERTLHISIKRKYRIIENNDLAISLSSTDLLFMEMPFLYLHNNRIDPTQTKSLSRIGKFLSYFIYLNFVSNAEANLKSLFCSLCFFPLFEDYHLPWYWQSTLHFSEKWHGNNSRDQVE